MICMPRAGWLPSIRADRPPDPIRPRPRTETGVGAPGIFLLCGVLWELCCCFLKRKASSVIPWQRQGGSHVWYKMAVVHEGFTEPSPFVCVAVDIHSRGFFVCRCLLGRLFCPAWYTRSRCISGSGLGRWYVRMLGSIHWSVPPRGIVRVGVYHDIADLSRQLPIKQPGLYSFLRWFSVLYIHMTRLLGRHDFSTYFCREHRAQTWRIPDTCRFEA